MGSLLDFIQDDPVTNYIQGLHDSHHGMIRVKDEISRPHLDPKSSDQLKLTLTMVNQAHDRIDSRLSTIKSMSKPKLRACYSKKDKIVNLATEPTMNSSLRSLMVSKMQSGSQLDSPNRLNSTASAQTHSHSLI